MKVAILDDYDGAYETTAGIHRLRQLAAVRIFREPFGEPAALRGFDALVATRERTLFTRRLLEQLADVRIIAQTGNHAYHIDLAAAEEQGIVVARASGGFSIGAAELAIGLAIAVMRRIPSGHDAIRENRWPAQPGCVLHGKTLGVIGVGRVGRHVARLGAAFGMRVLGWSPRLTDARATEAGVEARSLPVLLRESDVVSIHAALTAESRGLIDAQHITLMKPSACLINTARAAIVDEAALISALAVRRIAGAGLDVFDQEPLPASHPLRSLANVVLTPHIGWNTDEGFERFAAGACDVLTAFAEGREVPRFTL